MFSLHPTLRRISVAVVAIALVGCGKAPRKQCEEMCRAYSSLAFWEQANKEITAAPDEQQAALRAAKESEYAQKRDNGLEFCISKCRSANNEEDNRCVIAAKTFADAKKCTGQ